MAKEKESRVKSALGGKKSKAKKGKKKSVHKMHIRRTHNGKFLVDHEFKNEPGEEPMENETHALNPEELGDHVDQHMGTGEPPVAQGAPTAMPPAGPPAMPPAGPPAGGPPPNPMMGG
jgi:Cu/Zn superoxide dismutase